VKTTATEVHVMKTDRENADANLVQARAELKRCQDAGLNTRDAHRWVDSARAHVLTVGGTYC
jgi:hypothetical protein